MQSGRPLVRRAGSGFRPLLPIVVDVHATDDPLPRFALPGEASDVDRTWRQHNDDADRTWPTWRRSHASRDVRREVVAVVADVVIEEAALFADRIETADVAETLPRPAVRPISTPPPAFAVDVDPVDDVPPELPAERGWSLPTRLALAALGILVSIGVGAGLATQGPERLVAGARPGVLPVTFADLSTPVAAKPVEAKPVVQPMTVKAAPVLTGTALTGTVLTPAAARSHRLFIDGSVVGSAGKPVQWKCGAHVVKIGSMGKPQKIDIPCGGSVDVSLK